MARIIVIADTPLLANIDAPVLMDEEVKPDHLTDEHASRPRRANPLRNPQRPGRGVA
jgi:hypothetical protein